MSIPYWPRGGYNGGGGATSTILVSSFQQLFTSSLSADGILLDDQVLNATSNDLLLNGTPLVGSWATKPATTSVNMNGYDIANANSIYSKRNYTELVIASSIITNTIFSFSTVETNISTLNIVGQSAYFSSLNGADVNFLLSSISTANGQDSVKNWAFYPALNPVQLNENPITSSNISLNATNDINLNGNDVFLTADEGIAPNVANINLVAKNGVGGSINLTADTGIGGTSYGAINLTANGGSTAGIGTGGSINIVANTPSGTLSNASSKVTINAAGVNVYAGAIAPVASVTGYLFNYGTLGINNCVGLPSVLPNFPGTLYNYATGGIGYGGIRFESPAGVECINNTDFYAYRIYPYFNPFAVGTLPDMLISGRTHTVQNTQYLNLELVKNLKFGDNSNEGVITGVQSINGIPYPPPLPPVITISTFQSIYTEAVQPNPLNADSILISTPTSQIALANTKIKAVATEFTVSTGTSEIRSQENLLYFTGQDIYLNSKNSLDITAKSTVMRGDVSISSIYVSSINGQPWNATSNNPNLVVSTLRSGGETSIPSGNYGLNAYFENILTPGQQLVIQSIDDNIMGIRLYNGNDIPLEMAMGMMTPYIGPTRNEFRFQGPIEILPGVNGVYEFTDTKLQILDAGLQVPQLLGISSINGQPWNQTAIVVSTFNNLYTNTLQASNGSLLISSSSGFLQFQNGMTQFTTPAMNLTTGTTSLYSQSLGLSAVADNVSIHARSTLQINSVSTIMNGDITAFALHVSSINNAPYPPTQPASQTVSTFQSIYTEAIQPNPLNADSILISTPTSQIALANTKIKAVATEFTVSTGTSEIRSQENLLYFTGQDIYLNSQNSLDITAKSTVMRGDVSISSIYVSSINGQPYIPGGGGTNIVAGNQLFYTNTSTLNVEPYLTVSAIQVVYEAPDTLSTIITPGNTLNQLFIQANTCNTPWFTTPFVACKQAFQNSNNWYMRFITNSGTYEFLNPFYGSNMVFPLAPTDTYIQFETSNVSFPYWNEFTDPLIKVQVGSSYYIQYSNTITPSYVIDWMYEVTGSNATSTIITIPGASNYTLITPSSISTKALFVSSINGSVYPPVLPPSQTISTFKSIYTEAVQPSPLNADSISISTPTSFITLANTKIKAVATEFTVSTGTSEIRSQVNLLDFTGQDIYLNSQNSLNITAKSTILKGNVNVSTLTVSSINGFVFPQPPQQIPMNLNVSTLTVNGLLDPTGVQTVFVNPLQGNPAGTNGLYIASVDTDIAEIGYRWYNSNIVSMNFGFPEGLKQIRFNNRVQFNDVIDVTDIVNLQTINGQPYPPNGSGTKVVAGNQLFYTNTSTLNVNPVFSVSSVTVGSSTSNVIGVSPIVLSNVNSNFQSTTPWFSPNPSKFYFKVPDSGAPSTIWQLIGNDTSTTYYNNTAPQFRFTGVYYTSSFQKVVVPNWNVFNSNSFFPIGAYVETFVSPLDTNYTVRYYPNSGSIYYDYIVASNSGGFIKTDQPYFPGAFNNGIFVSDTTSIQPSFVSTSQLYVSTIFSGSMYLSPSTLIKSGSGFPELQVYNPSTLSTGQMYASAYRVGGFEGDSSATFYTRDTTGRATYVNSNLQTNRLLYTIDSNAYISSLSTNIIRFQAGQYSTLMYVSTPTSAGIASNTLYIDRNSDFSVFNNNIYAGQLKIGFNQVSGTAGANRRAEITFYNQVDTGYDLNVQNGDYAIRYATSQSTLTTATEGYLLDTTINNPFLSSVNYSMNLMAKFLPSNVNGTIGASTLSVFQNYIWSGYSSTSQAVLNANTITPLTFNSQVANIGGFTQLGSTIRVPASGVYSLDCSIQFITSSGGRNDAYWFLQKNGVPVPQTSSRLTVNNATDNVGTTVFTDFANAGDQYSFCIYSADLNMLAGAQAPLGPVPAIPSVIANIRRLG